MTIGYSQLLTCRQQDPINEFYRHPSVDIDSSHSFIPSLYIYDSTKIDTVAISHALSLGLKFISGQSLFFGSDDSLFGNFSSYLSFLERLALVAELTVLLKANYLIFGSPNNRSGSSYFSSSAVKGRLEGIDNLMADFGLIFCIEHVCYPYCDYNETFCTSLQDTCELVSKLALDNIRVNADLAMFMTHNKSLCLDSSTCLLFTQSIIDSIDLIGHVHLSTPGLRQITTSEMHLINYEIVKPLGKYNIPMVYEILP